jgi:hypothetical protein
MKINKLGCLSISDTFTIIKYLPARQRSIKYWRPLWFYGVNTNIRLGLSLSLSLHLCITLPLYSNSHSVCLSPPLSLFLYLSPLSVSARSSVYFSVSLYFYISKSMCVRLYLSFPFTYSLSKKVSIDNTSTNALAYLTWALITMVKSFE